MVGGGGIFEGNPLVEIWTSEFCARCMTFGVNRRREETDRVGRKKKARGKIYRKKRGRLYKQCLWLGELGERRGESADESLLLVNVRERF